MPPEVITHCQYSPSVTPPLKSPLLPPPPPPPKPRPRRMKFTKKKLIPILVCILTGASVLRLFKITITSTTTAASYYSSSVSSPSAALSSVNHHVQSTNSSCGTKDRNSTTLTEKELRFLSNIVAHRAPCNILVFGLEQQYAPVLTSLNPGGITMFLDHQTRRNRTVRGAKNRVHRVEYRTVARKGFELLRQAREDPSCLPKYLDSVELPRCKLALQKLPEEVYLLKWDIILVDGPCGDYPDSPGRMAAIYTAAVLARRKGPKNATNVLVHDVDRMIEKWFSWEFLCEENLVSSKGKFWNFRIAATHSKRTTKFCSR